MCSHLKILQSNTVLIFTFVLDPSTPPPPQSPLKTFWKFFSKLVLPRKQSYDFLTKALWHIGTICYRLGSMVGPGFKSRQGRVCLLSDFWSLYLSICVSKFCLSVCLFPQPLHKRDFGPTPKARPPKKGNLFTGLETGFKPVFFGKDPSKCVRILILFTG